jgi:hypothetical protein
MRVSLSIHTWSWTFIDFIAVIYYASNIFVSLGLTGGTTSLLATGVTGVVFMVSTIPAMVRLRNNHDESCN